MWLDTIREVSRGTEDPIPEGFITIDQVQEIFGVCRSKVMLRLLKLNRAGRLEKRKIRRLCSNGKIRWIGVYKIITK
jgi:predicted transcriptional regulator of viral defense system